MDGEGRHGIRGQLSKSCSPPRTTERLATRTVFADADVAVISTCWRRDEHPTSGSAETPAAIVELLDHGTFVRQLAGARTCVDRGTIAYFNPGETCRIEHPVGDENGGLWLRLEPAWWERAASGLGMAVSPEAPFHLTHAASTFALDIARRRLQTHLRERAGRLAETLGLEEALLDVLTLALHPIREARCAGELTPRFETCVEGAQLFLAENFRRRLRLADVAEAVGASRFALCRAFRALTGRSLHGHLVGLRLRAAFDEVEGGCTNLTDLALRSGFASHAHFSAAFRAAYGFPPSRAAAELGRGASQRRLGNPRARSPRTGRAVRRPPRCPGATGEWSEPRRGLPSGLLEFPVISKTCQCFIEPPAIAASTSAWSRELNSAAIAARSRWRTPVGSSKACNSIPWQGISRVSMP